MNTIQIYKGKGLRWRWRVVSSNGQVVAASGEAFFSKWNAKRAARKTFPGLAVREV